MVALSKRDQAEYTQIVEKVCQKMIVVSNPVFDAMLLAAISFGGKERKKTEDFVSETQLLLV